MDQFASLLGALVILAAYAGNQFGLLDRRDTTYNLMNLLGAVVLTVIAFQARQWGFVLLEGVWSLLAIPPLVRVARASGRR